MNEKDLSVFWDRRKPLSTSTVIWRCIFEVGRQPVVAVDRRSLESWGAGFGQSRKTLAVVRLEYDSDGEHGSLLPMGD